MQYEYILICLVVFGLALALSRSELDAIYVSSVLAYKLQFLISCIVTSSIVVGEVLFITAVYFAVVLLGISCLHLCIDEVSVNAEFHVTHEIEHLDDATSKEIGTVSEVDCGAILNLI